MNKRNTYLIIIFLIVTSFAAYGRIFNNGFINFDDPVYITENRHVQSGLNIETIKWAFTAIVSSNWHPLTLLSHASDWSLFNGHAGGHHLINLLLHIGNTLLLFLLLNKMTKAFWPSVFTAALFALHPLRVESVAWASERKDVLSAFFGLASLYAYAYYAEKRQLAKYFLCLLLFILGLMAKPMLVTLPFIMLLLDIWPLERWKKDSVMPSVSHVAAKKKKSKQQAVPVRKEPPPAKNNNPLISFLITEKIPFIILSIISSIVTLWAQSKGGAIAPLQKLPFFERLTNAIISYVSYLGKILWPKDLAIFYPYQHAFPLWMFLGSLFILFLISVLVILRIKKMPFLFVGWFWYLGTLIPVIGLVQVGRQALADRYTYLPSVGIGIIIAWGIPLLLKRNDWQKKILIPLGALSLIILMVLTWQQCGYWKNNITLFEHVLQVTNNNYLAHGNLGLALAAEGKSEEAITHYNAALKIKPDDDNAHYNLGNTLVRQNRIDEAIAQYREAVRINPRYFTALNNLGVNLEKQLKHDEAIHYYRQALQINDNNPGVYLNLGVALANSNKLPEAIEQFKKAIYLDPEYKEARLALKIALDVEKRREAK